MSKNVEVAPKGVLVKTLLEITQLRKR